MGAEAVLPGSRPCPDCTAHGEVILCADQIKRNQNKLEEKVGVLGSKYDDLLTEGGSISTVHSRCTDLERSKISVRMFISLGAVLLTICGGIFALQLMVLSAQSEGRESLLREINKIDKKVAVMSAVLGVDSISVP